MGFDAESEETLSQWCYEMQRAEMTGGAALIPGHSTERSGRVVFPADSWPGPLSRGSPLQGDSEAPRKVIRTSHSEMPPDGNTKRPTRCGPVLHLQR